MSKNMYLPKVQAQTLEYLMEQEWFYRRRNGYFETRGVTRKVILKAKKY